LRLKAAETNLTRVEDVIGQLAGQIDGLKKQARQAIRYREVAAKVRKAEAMLFHLRWLEANSDVAETALSTTSASATWPNAPANRPRQPDPGGARL
jgi:chromosome segregation protein